MGMSGTTCRRMTSYFRPTEPSTFSKGQKSSIVAPVSGEPVIAQSKLNPYFLLSTEKYV